MYHDNIEESESSQAEPSKRWPIELKIHPLDVSFAHKTSDEISDATRLAARRELLIEHHDLFGLGFVQALRDYIGYRNVRLNL